jgi:hypothetical protein
VSRAAANASQRLRRANQSNDSRAAATASQRLRRAKLWF